MRLAPNRQQVVDALIDDAHQAHEGIPRDVAAGIVEELHRLEGSGEAWVSTYVDDLTLTGAGRVYTDWRRRHEIDGKTKAGTTIKVPAFGGVTRTDDDGSVVHVQMTLAGMTLAELRALRNRKAAMRDTLSGEIKVYDALIEIMQERECATAGDALALMFGQAA